MSSPTARRWLRPALRALLTPVLGVIAAAAFMAIAALFAICAEWLYRLLAIPSEWVQLAAVVVLGTLISALNLLVGAAIAKEVIR